MAFLSNEKLVIVGAGGMIGSNMVQSVLMLGLTPNVCLYDIYEPGVHGVFEEMAHCAFPGANLTYTVDPKEAFTGAKYIISSGGAPRKAGMTREEMIYLALVKASLASVVAVIFTLPKPLWRISSATPSGEKTS